jgi:hypothetical protein
MVDVELVTMFSSHFVGVVSTNNSYSFPSADVGTVKKH